MLIHTIDLQFQGRAQAIAAFLVETKKGKVLIETGPESTRLQLLDSLEELNCPVSDLAGVFLTHIHLDHAGAAGWFAQQGVPLYVHRRGAKHLVDPARLEASARLVYGEAFDGLWGSLLPAPEDSVNSLEEGDVIDLAGLQVETIETPGHAFHHHSFAIGDVLFAGDAAGAQLPGSDYISVTSAPPQFHLDHSLASLDKLQARGFREVYLTHFGKVPDVEAHFSHYRDAVELNATFIKHRLEEQMDEEALKIAYQAFNMEQSFRAETAREVWETLQVINSTDMCADGIRLYWEKQLSEGT